jgi:phytoene dehydrogenase-like protein
VTIGGSIVGAVISIFGPKIFMHLALRKLLRPSELYNWPAPVFEKEGGDEKFDVAVIGAGNGGLTAAALLADAGARVLVAEQHDAPGGFCQCWTREVKHFGATHVFRFDSGVHDISGVRPGGSITSILERLGIDTEIEWARLDHTYHIWRCQSRAFQRKQKSYSRTGHRRERQLSARCGGGRYLRSIGWRSADAGPACTACLPSDAPKP